MRMRNLLTSFRNFQDDECGAVTVDWVVLTAGIVGLGLVVMTMVVPKVTTSATNIKNDVVAKQALATALNP